MAWDEELQELLRESGEDRFYQLHFYETVGSTNEIVKQAAEEEQVPEGYLVIADEQTAGKGRRGRVWKSPRGETISFSFLLRPAFPAEYASSLTLLMGLSVAQAIRELYALAADIKWPNDVVIGKKKVCGILTEAGARDGKLDYVVAGIGINANNLGFPEELSDRATSLRVENAGKPVSKAHIVALALKRFRRYYTEYQKTCDLSAVLTDYNFLLVSRDQEVRIEDPNGSYQAVSRGIDERGRLIVELMDGSEQRIDAGEVSVRGMYGYI